MAFGTPAPKCKACGKSVFPMEKIEYDNQIFHEACFKCQKCKSRVILANVAMIKGDLYCKPCFKKTFAEKGSYATFGEKNVSQWATKNPDAAGAKRDIERAHAHTDKSPNPSPGPSPTTADGKADDGKKVDVRATMAAFSKTPDAKTSTTAAKTEPKKEVVSPKPVEAKVEAKAETPKEEKKEEPPKVEDTPKTEVKQEEPTKTEEAPKTEEKQPEESKPAEQQPTEQPTEQPAEQPTEQPAVTEEPKTEAAAETPAEAAPTEAAVEVAS
jgi:hypothetical protein